MAARLLRLRVVGRGKQVFRLAVPSPPPSRQTVPCRAVRSPRECHLTVTRQFSFSCAPVASRCLLTSSCAIILSSADFILFYKSLVRCGYTHTHGRRCRRVRDMNRGPTVAQPLPVDRYAGNCLIKPLYYCGTGGTVSGGGVGAHCNNAALEQQPRCRYDFVTTGYHQHHHHSSPPQPPTPYQHYQQLQDWYGRTAYWHHHQQHQHHHQQQQQQQGGGPLAEKAHFTAHKHGAPLIQAAKYNRAGATPGSVIKKYAKKAPAEQPNSSSCNGCGGNKKNDGGSDESSGAASENSLPRIIKPRKRRKKERKPPPVSAVVVQMQSAAVQPLVIAAVSERDDRPSSSSSSSLSSSPPPPVPSQQQQQLYSVPVPLIQQQQQQQQQDAPFDTIRLSADIKAVSLEDVSTCQCACCDPVGNVWDVGRRCFSPSLTRPEPARRSWSGGEPSVSSNAVACTLAAKPEASVVSVPVRVRTHSLEVSSEIVTSHNGHRDIEIKFFTMPIGGDH